MSESELTECPHCGDDQGFYYRYSERMEQQNNWAGEGVHNQDLHVIGGYSKNRCISCNKVVNVPRFDDDPVLANLN